MPWLSTRIYQRQPQIAARPVVLMRVNQQQTKDQQEEAEEDNDCFCAWSEFSGLPPSPTWCLPAFQFETTFLIGSDMIF